MIEDMSYKEIADKLNLLFQEIERHIEIPVEMQHRFGLWAELKDTVDEIAQEYEEAVDDYRKIKKGIEDICQKMRDTYEEMQHLQAEDDNESEINAFLATWGELEEVVDVAINDYELDMVKSSWRKRKKK